MNADIDVYSVSSAIIKNRKLNNGEHLAIIYIQDANGGSLEISLYSDNDLHITQLEPEVK